MKAIMVTRFGGPEVLAYQDVPDPVAQPGEIIIKSTAISMNFADTRRRAGGYPGGGTPPFIPGIDLAGEVVAAGPGVSNLRVGDRVAAMTAAGSYAEYVRAPAALTYPVPDGVDLEAAAAFPVVGITAYNILTLAGRLQPGETVLIHSAAGGVGSVAVQLARRLGAGLVIGAVGDDAKMELPLSLGCDHVVNYRSADLVARVRELTGGAGADLVLDAVAGSMFDRSLECLKSFGRLVVYGMAGGEPGRARSDQLHATNRAVIGYSTGGHRQSRPEALRPAAEAVLNLMAQGQLTFVIGGRYPLANAAEAMRLIESRQSTGKILLFP